MIWRKAFAVLFGVCFLSASAYPVLAGMNSSGTLKAKAISGEPPQPGRAPAESPSAGGVASVDPGNALNALINEVESAYAKVNDYEAIFFKQERVGGEMMPKEKILMKFRKPLDVYMKWIGERYRGKEALYVQGKYDDKVIGHLGGGSYFSTWVMSSDPDGWLAMRGNRHPITQAGFGYFIENWKQQVEKSLKYGDFRLIRMGEEVFNGRPSTIIESVYIPRDGRKYYCSRGVVHIDRQHLLPFGYAAYGRSGKLLEKYSYSHVELNVGLTDKDFSRNNEKYHF